MGYFTQQTESVPIDSDDLATALDVVVVRKLTYQERQRCLSTAMKVRQTASRAKGKDADIDLDIDAALLATEQVAAALVSWSGPGFEGRPATRENLLTLPPDVVDRISAAADKLNQSLSAEEKN